MFEVLLLELEINVLLPLLLANEAFKSVINVFGNIGGGARWDPLNVVESNGDAALGKSGGKGVADGGGKNVAAFE